MKKIILSAMAICACSFANAQDQKVKWFEIFKTYLILHCFYGMGYLKGALDFFLLNKTPSNKQKRLSR